MSFRVFACSVAVAGVLVAGCHDSTAPPRPARVVLSAGSISGTVNAAVSPTPTFTVLDDAGKPITKVAVTVAVSSGGGTLSGAPTASTGSSTPVGTWVLGPAPGANTLTVTVAGVTPAVLTATARSAYSVDLRFVGPTPDASVLAAFQAAKARIETVVTTDLSDVSTTTYDIASCGLTGGPQVTEPVDDIIIYAAVDSIDGPGGILGSSGPCYVRNVTNGLPVIGVMHFDKADLQNLVNTGQLNDVILHEMLHSLGVGTLWQGDRLTINFGTSTTAFIGGQAIAECQATGGGAVCASSVPLENTGQVGTRDVHWRETTFKTELMTGFISAAGTPNPLSRITVGSLADLGYVVNLGAADTYTVPSAAAASYEAIEAAKGHGGFTINERMITPTWIVHPDGRVTRIPR